MEDFKEFIASELDYYWAREPRVSYDGDWNTFRSRFDGCGADLLATQIRTSSEGPEWHGWATLVTPVSVVLLPGDMIAALLPLIRLSRAAVEAILAGMDAGWDGHPEVLIPTLVRFAGLTIEDIGESGSFTPPERRGRWYDDRTWHWRGPVEYVPGMLHFPVPVQTREFAKSRLSKAGQDGEIGDGSDLVEETSRRILFVSPVGEGSRKLLPGTLATFQSAGADILLLQYDAAELSLPSEASVIRDKASKWQLAARHLHPDRMKDYDYVFFWDDDLDTAGFDPRRFVRLMERNRLDVAQPAIRSLYPLSHVITGQLPCPPPLVGVDGRIHSIVGRLTNFVEIMAPVYTRQAWKELHDYVDPESWSGWGLDYVPLGRKGIVDALPVVHTRAVQSVNAQAHEECLTFMGNQGLVIHTAVNMGWLFE